MTEPFRLFCFAPYAGNYAVHHQLDLVVSLGVKIKGGETVSIGCDKLYSNCEVVMHAPEHLRKIECANCAFKGKNLLSHEVLPFHVLNEFMTPAEIATVEKWVQTQTPLGWKDAVFQGDPLGEWSLSSLYVAFQISRNQLDQARLVPFYQSLLRNSALTAIAVKRVIESFRPDAAFVFNARFAVYRTAYEILRRNNIRVIIHERGFTDNTFIFFENSTIVDSREFFKIIDLWQNAPLSTDELAKVTTYVESREKGVDMNLPAYINYSTDKLSIRNKLFVEKEDLIGFFSSTEAEITETEEYNIANVQLPFLEKIINNMHLRPDVTLVIRHHPNLAGSELHPPEYKFITELYRILVDAPENIRVIMPTEKLSTYSLLWHLQGAIAPFSTVGIEAPMRGNVSMASNAYPSSRGQVLEFNDVESFDVANAIDSLLEHSHNFSTETLRKAYRFIHSYIQKLSIRFKSVGIKDFYDKNISPDVISDLSEDRDENLSRIVNGLMNNTSVYPEPTAERAAYLAEEEAYLAKEVEKIMSYKKELYQKSIEVKKELHEVLVLQAAPRKTPFPASFCERYPGLIHKEIQISQDKSVFLKHLYDIVSSASSEFVAYIHQYTSLDGNFICSGIEALKEAPSEVQCLVRGMWISDAQGSIEDEFLTKRKGEASYKSITQFVGQKFDPFSALGMGFYRKDFFLALIHNLQLLCQKGVSEEELLEQIAMSWSHPSVTVEKVQVGVVVHADSLK